MDTARAKVNVIEHDLEEMGNLSKIFDRQLNDTQEKYNVDSVLNRVDSILNEQKQADNVAATQTYNLDPSFMDSFNIDHLNLTIDTKKQELKLEEKSVGTTPTLAASDKKDAAVSAPSSAEPVPSQEKPTRDVSNIRTEIQEQKSFNLAWLDESQLRTVKKSASDAKNKPVSSVKAPVTRPKSATPSVVSKSSTKSKQSVLSRPSSAASAKQPPAKKKPILKPKTPPRIFSRSKLEPPKNIEAVVLKKLTRQKSLPFIVGTVCLLYSAGFLMMMCRIQVNRIRLQRICRKSVPC